VAAELVRVCRPGGRIVMGNWTPEGFVGRMFKTTGTHVPPAGGMPAPVLWGKEELVRERLGEGVADLQLTRKMYPMSIRSRRPKSWSSSASTTADQSCLCGTRSDKQRTPCEMIWSSFGRAHNQASDGGTEIESEYLLRWRPCRA